MLYFMIDVGFVSRCAWAWMKIDITLGGCRFGSANDPVGPGDELTGIVYVMNPTHSTHFPLCSLLRVQSALLATTLSR